MKERQIPPSCTGGLLREMGGDGDGDGDAIVKRSFAHLQVLNADKQAIVIRDPDNGEQSVTRAAVLKMDRLMKGAPTWSKFNFPA